MCCAAATQRPAPPHCRASVPLEERGKEGTGRWRGRPEGSRQRRAGEGEPAGEICGRLPPESHVSGCVCVWLCAGRAARWRGWGREPNQGTRVRSAGLLGDGRFGPPMGYDLRGNIPHGDPRVDFSPSPHPKKCGAPPRRTRGAEMPPSPAPVGAGTRRGPGPCGGNCHP